MYHLELRKPDGRNMTLYSRRPIDEQLIAPSPVAMPQDCNPHLRWHPLRAEWVAYAAYRQNRTFLPPADYNPLAPQSDPQRPTELPAGDYDIAVMDNLFPVLTPAAHDAPVLEVATRPAHGRCEVTVFTQDAGTSLGELPLDHIELVLEVWGARTEVLTRNREHAFVLPFENRGVEMGVTLEHPHGQIYAYPFLPPLPRMQHDHAIKYFQRHAQTLLSSMLDGEVSSGKRLLYAGPHALAFVPICARYPYEVWIAPRNAVPYLHHLSVDVRQDLARALKTVLLKYDGLWQRRLPYLMAWYQAPTDGQPHPETHLHAQLYPPCRSRDRLKYLAGTELAAGLYANDRLPEETACELQAVPVHM